MATKTKQNTDAQLAIKAADTDTIVQQYGKTSKDTGATEVQIALLTKRILLLTDHLQIHKKDHHTRRGLLHLVGKRRRFLNYLMKNSIEEYRTLIQKLGIRK